MTIYFDKNSAYWSIDNEKNECFINVEVDFLRDMVKHRGYVYLNQIHEILGIAWDPERENLCIDDPCFTVVIGWDDKHDRWIIDID